MLDKHAPTHETSSRGASSYPLEDACGQGLQCTKPWWTLRLCAPLSLWLVLHALCRWWMPLIISLSFFKIVLALWATWLWQSRFSKLTCRVGMWIPNPYTRLTFYEGSMTLWAIHQRLWSWNGYLAQTPGTLTTSSLQVIGTKILLKFCAFPTSAYELVHHNFLERGVSNVQHRCGIKSMRGVGTKVPLLWCDGVTWNMYIHTIGWLWMPRSLSQEIRSSSILNTVSIDANMTMSWFQQMGILNNLTFMHMHQNVNEEQMPHGPWRAMVIIILCPWHARSCPWTHFLQSRFPNIGSLLG